MYLTSRVLGVGGSSGAWEIEFRILRRDSDGLWGVWRSLDPPFRHRLFFFDVPRNIPGYPDEIREAAHMLVDDSV